MLTGFGTLLAIHLVVPHTHMFHERGKTGKLVVTAFLVSLGMILHDFPEGFSMASSYLFSAGLGMIVMLSIALHNIPEGFAIAIPLILTNRKGFLYKMTFLSAFAEPIGAVLGIALVSIIPMFNPLFLAFGAGAMIFVSVDELFPLAMNYHKPAFFAFGMGISFAVYFGMNLLF
jgi:ZIP family zinc transporter